MGLCPLSQEGLLIALKKTLHTEAISAVRVCVGAGGSGGVRVSLESV